MRHYDSVLRALVARGHEVELVRERLGDNAWPPFVRALVEACPGIRLANAPDVSKDKWWELATRLRRARFYLRFLEPLYASTPALLTRARKRAPEPAVRLGATLGRVAWLRRLLVRALDVLEQSTRSAMVFHELLRDRRPDLVVMTPLVVLKTGQLDLARAAMELGVRNVFAVASWDHLSSKGELNFSPQRTLVWNDVQRREAVELHGLPADRIVITGSQVFDDWFGRQPSTTRAAFCARVGLRADRPIILYVCSALLEGSPPEPPFVVRWARHLRASGHPVLEDCGILIRPHYQHGEAWRGVDFGDLGNIACWPPAGDAPVDARSKADYFDSMYHASATVGLNTSAMIEAAILNRPVHTVLLPEFMDSQEGTVHFHYLLDSRNPLLRATRSLDDHAADLAGVLAGRDPDPDRSARFVRAFVRPAGVDVPATTRVVEALEELAAQPAPAPVPVPVWTHLVRPLLIPFANTAAARARLRQQEAARVKRARLTRHREAKQLLLEERRREKAAAKEQREAKGPAPPGFAPPIPGDSARAPSRTDV